MRRPHGAESEDFLRVCVFRSNFWTEGPCDLVYLTSFVSSEDCILELGWGGQEENGVFLDPEPRNSQSLNLSWMGCKHRHASYTAQTDGIQGRNPRPKTMEQCGNLL